MSLSSVAPLPCKRLAFALSAIMATGVLPTPPNANAADFPTTPNAPAANQTPATGDVVALQRVALHDDLAQTDAYTLLVPVGWKAESKFDWRFDHVDPVHPLIRVYNPAGAQAITSFGGNWAFMDWSQTRVRQQVRDGANTYGFSVQTQFKTPADFVTRLGLRYMSQDLQRAQLVDVTDMPTMVSAALARYPNRKQLSARVNRLRFEYSANGVAVQEDVYCTVYSDPPSQQTGAVTWSAEVLAFRAEKGKLDDAMGLLLAIRSSVQVEPRWYQDVLFVVQSLQQQIGEQQRREMCQIQMRNAAAQKVGQDIVDRAAAANAASNKSAELWDQKARGVETRVNPVDNKPIEVPSGYAHAFVNPAGEVLLSNNPNYNPNGVNAIPPGLSGGFQKADLAR